MAKFFVCTMYCGELDLPHCIKALSEQGADVEHRLISFLDEVAAHNVVYQAFNEAPVDRIRVKLDADVVLSPGALVRIGNAASDPRSWVTPTVHDFFTDTEISAGIAVYGASVRFKVQDNSLKCDRGVEIGARGQSALTCVGKHAFFSDERAAFHFGFHRGLKSQPHVADAVRRAQARNPDRRRAMALKGFDAVHAFNWSEEDPFLKEGRFPDFHVYGHPVFERVYAEALAAP